MVHGNCLAHTFEQSFRAGMFLAGVCLLKGCSGYAFNINDNPVYRPPSLFSAYRIEDRALADCVQQSIEDQRVTEAGQLTQLNCSSAGISTLDGLGTFTGLKAISLADNQLETIEELSQLSRLEILVLKNNQIVSAEPLLALLRLKELDLQGNEALECRDAQQLANNNEGKVSLPEDCAE